MTQINFTMLALAGQWKHETMTLRRINADLVAALEAAVNHWMAVHELTEVSSLPDHWINKARAALRVAKGETDEQT